jgi:hypothetical protein
MLGVNKSWKLVVSSHGQPEEQNLGLAVIYSCVSFTEGLVDVLFTVCVCGIEFGMHAVWKVQTSFHGSPT